MGRLDLPDVRRDEDEYRPDPERLATQLRPPISPVTDEDIDDEASEAFDAAVFHRSCYLAGPMRGIEDYNFPAFEKAAADLRSRGWKVFSPHELGSEQGDDPKGYLAQELPYICTEADAVICLPDWEFSEGANLEVHCARVCGKPVLQYGPDGELTEIPVAAPPVRIDFDPKEIDAYVEWLHGQDDGPKEESVCQEADRLVATDRQDVYGHPLDDFTKVTEAAKALGIDPHKGPEHHALYMILVKLARLESTPGHHDSIVDICGYAKTYDMVLKERDRRAAVDG